MKKHKCKRGREGCTPTTPLCDACGEEAAMATPDGRTPASVRMRHLARLKKPMTGEDAAAIGLQVLFEIGDKEFFRSTEIAFLSNMRNAHEARRDAVAAKKALLGALAEFSRATAALAEWERDHVDAVARVGAWSEAVRADIEQMLPETPDDELSAQEYVARYGTAFALAQDVASVLGDTSGDAVKQARRRAKAKLGTAGPAPRPERLKRG
ncbi:MAG: hypothetical protein JNK64_20950 [Myxococcales bacterium]|nr:hypothetical protein [Myxococcales bacterium]